MSLNIFWFLPTHGDGRYLAPARAHAPSRIITSSRLPRPPMTSVITAC